MDQLGAGTLVLPIGTRVGDYVVTENLGGLGNWRITYRATHVETGDSRILEEFYPQEFVRREGVRIVPRSDEARSALRWGLIAFVNEARILQRQRQPALQRVFDVIEDNGTGYFLSEELPPIRLSDRLAEVRTLSIDDTRNLIMELVGALQVAAADGYLHRDINPRQIRFRGSNPVLCDFAGGRNAMRFKARNINDVVTAGFAPPELYALNGKQGPWTDIYGLAAVAFNCITGKAPTDALSREKGAALIRLSASDDSNPFLAGIDWGLELDPTQRPQSLEQWAEVLRGDAVQPSRVTRSRNTQAAATSASPGSASVLARPGNRQAAPQAVEAETAAEPEAKGRLPLIIGGVVVAALVLGIGAKFLVGGSTPQTAAEDGDTAIAQAETEMAAATDNSDTETSGFNMDVTDDEAGASFEQTALQQMRLESARREAAQKAADEAAQQAEAARQQAEEDARAEEQRQKEAELNQALQAAQQAQAQKAAAEPDPQVVAMQQELERLRVAEEQRKKAEAAAKAEAARKQAEAQAAETARMDALKQEVAKARQTCKLPAADLSSDGLLTYERAKLIKGAVIEKNRIRLPPVPVSDGVRAAIFIVTPDDCARLLAYRSLAPGQTN